MMFGFRSIGIGGGMSFNFAFRNYFNDFGTDTALNLYLKTAEHKFVFALHNYWNYEHYFPAIEIEMVDIPVYFGNDFFIYVSPRLIAGTQPRNQDFLTSSSEFFGLAAARVDFGVSRNFLPYVELIAKTDGWAAGSEFLEGALIAKAGLSARF
jgi:hypothetical protein